MTDKQFKELGFHHVRFNRYSWEHDDWDEVSIPQPEKISIKDFMIFIYKLGEERGERVGKRLKSEEIRTALGIDDFVNGKIDNISINRGYSD